MADQNVIVTRDPECEVPMLVVAEAPVAGRSPTALAKSAAKALLALLIWELIALLYHKNLIFQPPAKNWAVHIVDTSPPRPVE
jgi:hypothetical protein